MRLALAPKVAVAEADMAEVGADKAVAEEDTAVAGADKVAAAAVTEVDKAVAEEDMAVAEVDKVAAGADKGAADENQRVAPVSNHRLSTNHAGLPWSAADANFHRRLWSIRKGS